ncbi:aspartate--tRNA ligase 2, cytoplasmic-like [Arachis hypogaea]|uniref:aspartate--tRNA ligase 2, cytoplasmic-like n=1 Tax=Arachis hypogaea TaxID=3818 RepID=UPI003B223E84
MCGQLVKVEVQVRKLYWVSRALPTLPINLEDAACSEAEIEKALQAFRQFLLFERFCQIHPPKLIAGSSEGGDVVFRLDYKGHPACLAQSPQLHKHMAICADFGRVFEIPSHTDICVMDIGRLFVSIFDSLNQNCKEDLEAVAQK